MEHRIPPLIRCRGIDLGDGNYTGCAYGSGEIRQLTGPLDCPTCNGSGYEGVTATFIPHAEFGDPDCCGVLFGIVEGEYGLIGCNECDAVVRAVLSKDLQGTLTEMELSLDTCSEMCPRCKAVNLIVGFSEVRAYTCRSCGEVVRLSDDPGIDVFFGPEA
jgi:hypothetical protein